MHAAGLIEQLSNLENLGAVKAAIAAAGCTLLLLDRTVRARNLSLRARQCLGGLLAIASIAAWFHFFRLEYSGYYHRWEFFHYYLGAKYPKELGYERIYHCTALADAETGNIVAVRHRRMRDLSVDVLVPARQALEQPAVCKDHFSAARWEQFKADVAWLRGASGSGKWWNDMQADHGFNPSPVWTAAGHALVSIAPAGWRLRQRSLGLRILDFGPGITGR